MTTEELLAKAAAGSSFNATSPSIVRPSKAGQTLAALVLSQLVLPKLPQPESTSTPEQQLASTMSITTGFIFEVAAIPVLMKYAPNYTLIEQPELKWKHFSGRADYLLVSPDKSHVVVVDCKAFGVSTKREILERKLTTGWGYPTQLAIYGMGVCEQYPEADVELLWCCLCVPTRKVFFIQQEPAVTTKLAAAAEARVNQYINIRTMLDAGNYVMAAKALVNATYDEQLPQKGTFFGNSCASCPFHYSPYADIFYPSVDSTGNSVEQGYPLAGEELQRLLEQLMRDAYKGTNATSYQDYLTALVN